MSPSFISSRCVLLGALIAALAATVAAQTQIPLLNAGFETDTVPDGGNNGSITDWPFSGPFAATRNPSVAQTSIVEAPEGLNVAVMNSGTEITQVVSTTVTPGNSYQLSFMIGAGTLSGTGHTYVAGMRIGGQTVATRSPQIFPPSGGFRLASVTYTHPATSLPASSLELFIGHAGTGGGIFIDDVKLFEIDRYGASDHTFVDLECQAPGDIISATVGANCEPIDESTGSGTKMILPNGGTVTGPCAGMPTQGTQWVEINNMGTGPDTGATHPFSRLDARLYALTDTLAIDYNFLTEESLGGMPFFDTATAVLWDLSTDSFVFHSTYPMGNTQDTSLPWVTSSCSSGLSGNFANELDGAQTLRITIPPSLVGQPIAISFDVENNGDNAFESALFVDNIRFELPRERPGTGDGLQFGTAVDSSTGPLPMIGNLSGGRGNTTKSAAAGDTIHVGYHDLSGNFVNRPIFLAGQFFITGGSPPTPEYLNFGAWTNSDGFFLLNGYDFNPLGSPAVVLPFGVTHSFPVPAGLAGLSMLIQLDVLSTMAANGLVGTSDAHQIDFH